VRNLQTRQNSGALSIFGDIDSLVTEKCRSYSLNEVDGIESMEGIMMIGSTNHLGRLNPAISKCPSRFDRKYLFNALNKAERTLYCKYWREKLSKKKFIDFLESLCLAIAKITGDFSFAYLKELFITTLLVIVSARDITDSADSADDYNVLTMGEADELNSYRLERVIKAQVQAWRDEMSNDSENAQKVTFDKDHHGLSGA